MKSAETLAKAQHSRGKQQLCTGEEREEGAMMWRHPLAWTGWPPGLPWAFLHFTAS